MKRLSSARGIERQVVIASDGTSRDASYPKAPRKLPAVLCEISRIWIVSLRRSRPSRFELQTPRLKNVVRYIQRQGGEFDDRAPGDPTSV